MKESFPHSNISTLTQLYITEVQMKYFSPLGKKKKIGLHYNDMTLLKNTFCRDLKSSMLVDLLIWEGKSRETPHIEQE